MKTQKKVQIKLALIVTLAMFTFMGSFANKAVIRNHFSSNWNSFNSKRTGVFVGFPYGIPSSGVYVTVSGSAGSWSGTFTSSGPSQMSIPLPAGGGYTVTVTVLGSSASHILYDAENQVYTGSSSFYYDHWRYIGIKIN